MIKEVRGLLLLGSWLFMLVGCFGSTPPPEPTLRAPKGTNPQALAALNEGNQRFAVGQWGAAHVSYETAIQAQPNLAEAHYNLALTLERMGDQDKAREHYIQAANLAPGHKVIWDSPPLRRHGYIPDKPTDLEADSPVPGLGQGGRGVGGIGDIGR